jgi:hypothetical protein
MHALAHVDLGLMILVAVEAHVIATCSNSGSEVCQQKLPNRNSCTVNEHSAYFRDDRSRRMFAKTYAFPT